MRDEDISLTIRYGVYRYFVSFPMQDLFSFLAYNEFNLVQKLQTQYFHGKKPWKITHYQESKHDTDGLNCKLESLLSFWMLTKVRKSKCYMSQIHFL